MFKTGIGMSDTLKKPHKSISYIEEKNNLDEDFNVLKEVHYLNSIPELISSIDEVRALDDSSYSEEIEW